MTCETAKCVLPAMFRVFWPGSPSLALCWFCAIRAKEIANAMGMHLETQRLGMGMDEMLREETASAKGGE